MNVTLVLMAWPVLALIAFKVFASRQHAVLWVFLGGWLLLPVGPYPAGAHDSVFPYWLVGAAVPSDMLVAKSWVAPASAMLGVLLFDRQRLADFRFAKWDFPIVFWCAWPVLQAALRSDVQPNPMLASAYLFGSWGLTWMLGRLYFNHRTEQRLLLNAWVWAGLACIPFAILEGLGGAALYEWIYQPHPYAQDGFERYWGWRPVGFFEHGNQYGIWICLCALAAPWVWRSHHLQTPRAVWSAVGAAALLLMALLAQSVGAIFLLGLGVVGLHLMRYMRLQKILLSLLGIGVLGGAVYISGVAPITHWGKETVVGRKVVDVFKGVGRGSFTWRISQDQKAIALAKPVALVGHGKWDWWRSLDIRPWGLALMILGQYGLLGMLAAFGALLAPAVASLWRAPQLDPWAPVGAPFVLAMAVLLTLVDALLNSFIFFPAVMAAGALVPRADLKP